MKIAMKLITHALTLPKLRFSLSHRRREQPSRSHRPSWAVEDYECWASRRRLRSSLRPKAWRAPRRSSRRAGCASERSWSSCCPSLRFRRAPEPVPTSLVSSRQNTELNKANGFENLNKKNDRQKNTNSTTKKR